MVTVMSNTPLVAVVRYDAIGESSYQCQVVIPRLVFFLISRPLAIAVRPSGTVTAMS